MSNQSYSPNRIIGESLRPAGTHDINPFTQALPLVAAARLTAWILPTYVRDIARCDPLVIL